MPKLFTSRFFLAVIVFGAISLLAAAFDFCRSKPTDYPYRSWTAWTIDDFLHRRPAPGLVFLGSSLVLVPVAGIDANYLNHFIDGALHHHSAYFEDKFRDRTGIASSTFNFALPGEMPSDAYMITKFLLKDERRPNVIVWGVGPRDFMDNLLPSPASTDPFRFLSRFGDISNVSSLMMPEWTERFNYELGRAIFLYGKREDIANRCERASACLVNKVAALPAGCQPKVRYDVKQLVPEYKPFELGPGEAFFRPVPVSQKVQFLDNVDEYRRRYKKLNWKTFRTQMTFFRESLAMARQRGTRVVVVAMPITDINRGLLSDFAWKTYKETVSQTANANGAGFIDLTDDPRFQRSDFGDTVHLHGHGGQRWMDILVDDLSHNEVVVTALRNQPPLNRSVAGNGRPL